VTRILLVGCGKMGGAMLDGWLDLGLSPADMVVVEPQATAAAARSHVTLVADVDAVPEHFHPEVVVLAVKPQTMDAVLPPYRRFDGAVFLSIAAGRTLASYARLLGPEAAVIRAMPNTPAAVRRGMTVAVANFRVSHVQRTLCDGLLAAVGEVAWIADEGQMDAVTAVSGSGPAYVFLLAEALAAAGAENGLPPTLAAQLARATLIGAAELLRLSPDAPEVLRHNVTSPGGTTFAALAVLTEPQGLEALMKRAVAAACRRSRELAG
jgi:pyrroline-5-carboxylate reductase